jgi:hypothetical protein
MSHERGHAQLHQRLPLTVDFGPVGRHDRGQNPQQIRVEAGHTLKDEPEPKTEQAFVLCFEGVVDSAERRGRLGGEPDAMRGPRVEVALRA